METLGFPQTFITLPPLPLPLLSLHSSPPFFIPKTSSIKNIFLKQQSGKTPISLKAPFVPSFVLVFTPFAHAQKLYTQKLSFFPSSTRKLERVCIHSFEGIFHKNSKQIHTMYYFHWIGNAEPFLLLRNITASMNK